MMRFVLLGKSPFTSTLLSKADGGSWQGLNIIAIGPMGGKIVGYNAQGKAIYAGTPAATKLSGIKAKKISGYDPVNMAGEWLLSLGFPCHVEGKIVTVSEASGKSIAEHFGVGPVKAGNNAWHFDLHDLLSHVGEPLTPKTDEQKATFAAEAASGQLDADPFPDLATLKEIPAGKFAGSHGNKLFAAGGKKFVFKASDPVIARAEEAASRIGQLILGDKIPPAKFVKVGGVSGTLIGEVAGKELGPEHKVAVPTALLQAHFEDIAQHHVLDWLVSNHDGHAGNFLIDGDKLNAIDKGQAWKWIDKDKLSTGYNPNPSPIVYNNFWKQVAAGNIKGDVIKAVAKALEAAEKITPEQFESIITPYVMTAAKAHGFDAQQRIAQMTSRLINLRNDFNEFLSGVLGHTVKIPKKSENNFETMPDSKPGPKVEEPVAPPPTIAAEPPPAPAAQPAPGWPLTKGKITIHHPGDPPKPGVKWPSGYPGPGFKSEIDYKGKKYHVEFHDDAGKLAVVVQYPNGFLQSFDSPNKASDSLYLFHNSLPLDMSATEKKVKGISLPATKTFGIAAFASELGHASKGDATPTTSAAMTVQKLEAEKIVTPEQPVLSAGSQIEKLAHGSIVPLDMLPIDLQEFVGAHEGPIGTSYAAALPPGVPVVLHNGEGKKFVVIASLGNISQTIYYHGFPIENGTIDPLKKTTWSYQMTDATYNLESLPEIAMAKKNVTAPEPKTTAQEVGPPPSAELPPTAIVPPNAPAHSPHPVPVGTILTVKKKGVGEVSLKVADDGSFIVTFADGTGGGFESLNAACDHVWVKQQGHANVAAYKLATGSKKVPSGGGWKFWGIKPGATEPVLSTPPPPPAPASVAEPNPLAGDPMLAILEENEAKKKLKVGNITVESLDAAAIGTKIHVINAEGDGGIYTVTKLSSGKWQANTDTAPTFPAFDVAGYVGTTKHEVKIEEPSGPLVPTVPTTQAFTETTNPGKSNWEWFDAFHNSATVPSAVAALDTVPLGSEIKFQWSQEASVQNAGVIVDTVTLVKVTNDEWTIKESPNASPMMAHDIAMLLHDPNGGVTGNVKLSKPGGAASPKKFPTAAEMDAAPEGTLLSAWYEFQGSEKNTTWEKMNGVWVPPSGKGADSAASILSAMSHMKLTEMDLHPPAATAPVEKPLNPIMITADALHLAAPGSKIFYQKPQGGGLIAFEKQANGQWETGMGGVFDSDGLASLDLGGYFMATTDGLKVPPPPAPPAPAPSAPVSGKGAIHTSIATLPQVVQDTLQKPMETGKAWATTPTTKKGVTLGMKPTNWPGWVPPPGVILEGMWGGKRYFAMVGVTAKKLNGANGPNISWIVCDEVGNVMQGALGAATKTGCAATLKDAWDKHFTIPYSNKIFLKAFGLADGSKLPHFEAGSTALTVASGAPPAPAAPKKTPSADNFETMPIGTKIVSGAHTLTKLGDDHWQGSGGKFDSSGSVTVGSDAWAKNLMSAFNMTGAASVTLGSGAPKKSAEQVQKEKEAKEAHEAATKKAKEVAEWAKAHPPVTDADQRLILSYVQKQIGSMLVRAAGGADVLIKTDSPAFAVLLAKMPAGSHKVVETPAGPMTEVDVHELAKYLDATNKPGEKITGPDGKEYPAGTKFKTIKTETTAQQGMEAEPGFYKFTPHETDKEAMALKVADTKPTGAALITEWAKKYGLTLGPIVVGKANTIATVKKAELAKIWKTEEHLSVELPELPPTFVSAPLPSVPGVGVQDGQPGHVNTGDLLALDVLKPSAMGHSIRLGKFGVFLNNQVFVRKVQKSDGTSCYEVFGDLQKFPTKHGLAKGTFQVPSCAGTKISQTPHPQQTYDKDTGVQKEKGGGNSYAAMSAITGATSNGSSIRIIDSANTGPTMHGAFSIRIDEGKDIKSELEDAFQKMGLNVGDAMAEPTADDDRVLKKFALAKALAGTLTVNGEPQMIALRKKSEAELDAFIATKEKGNPPYQPPMPGVSALLNEMKVEQVFEGKQVPVIESNIAKAKKEGVAFIYAGMQLGEIFARLKGGTGMASNKRKMLNGIETGNAASVGSDVHTGGVCGVFTRFGNVNAGTSSWGYKCDHNPLLIFKPDSVKRTDWYAQDGDTCGAITGGGDPMLKALSYKTSNNEVMFEDGISHKEIAGVVVRSQEEKTQMLKWLTSEGIKEVNGIEIDKLVIVHAGKSRKFVADNLIGLQAGATQ